MKKTYKKIIFIILLTIIYIYVCNITLFPNNLILMQGEEPKYKTILGLNIMNKSTLQTSTNLSKKITEQVGKKDLELKLFNFVPVKDVTINVIPKTTVIPLGKTIGMKLYTEGVLVVGMSEIEGTKPYENTGIEAGNRIIEINDKKISTTNELIECVNSSNGKELEIKYINNNDETKYAEIKPTRTIQNEYKIGLWVRDAAAGVGTITFYEPKTGEFASLGHGINDVDTYELIEIANGELVTARILDIVKGQNGIPGEMRGTIEDGITIGTISKNTEFGVYGKLENVGILNAKQNQKMEVADRNEITTGKAEILCQIENGKTEKYEIEIQKIFKENNKDNKSMLIKITDEKLIEKTGGIIQGMSGAPIIQNNKFIGAVTHVLVNDSKVGYGVFADLMIKQLKEVEK